MGQMLQIQAFRTAASARRNQHIRHITAKPQLLPIRFPPPRDHRHGPLALWHLLSLDAPTVAALWTWFLARAYGVALPPTAVLAMFLAVWLLYAGDRLLDARLLDSRAQTQLEARHRFHDRHRRAFLTAIAATAAMLALLLPQLPFASLQLYLIEGSFLAGYFVILHGSRAAHRLPKEFAVGLFFAAAVFIPTVARAPDLRLTLLLPTLLFAALCTLNCLFIYAWEHPQSDSGPVSPHPSTQIALRLLQPLAAALLIASLCTLRPDAAGSSWNVPAAIALSSALLLLLDRKRSRLSAVSLRATADLTLLTPLLFSLAQVLHTRY